MTWRVLEKALMLAVFAGSSPLFEVECYAIYRVKESPYWSCPSKPSGRAMVDEAESPAPVLVRKRRQFLRSTMLFDGHVYDPDLETLPTGTGVETQPYIL